VGVFGAWGSGKTTLLSLVEQELRRLNKAEHGQLKGTHTETTWVNVWQVSNEEDIWAAFLQSLLLKVKEEMPWHRRLLFNIMGVIKWQVDWRLATKRVVLFLVRIVIVVVPLYFSLSNLVPSSQAGQSVPETIAAGAGTLFSSVLFLVQYWGGIWSSSHIFKR
jgi:predicted ATPase